MRRRKIIVLRCPPELFGELRIVLECQLPVRVVEAHECPCCVVTLTTRPPIAELVQRLRSVPRSPGLTAAISQDGKNLFWDLWMQKVAA